MRQLQNLTAQPPLDMKPNHFVDKAKVFPYMLKLARLMGLGSMT